MSVRSFFLVGTALFGTVLASSLARPVSATTISFSDFSDVSGWQLNGDADTAISGSQTVLRVTPAQIAQSGSAFFGTPIPFTEGDSFNAFFQFRISNSGGITDTEGTDFLRGGDGLTFALVDDPTSLGFDGGSGLGYIGIFPSIAIEFDTFANPDVDGFNGNHVGYNIFGSVNSFPLAPIATPLNNGSVYSAWIDFDGSTGELEVRLSDTAIRPIDPLFSVFEFDLPFFFGNDSVFVGFTSGTGEGFGDHDILNFSFSSSSSASTPEPGTVLGLLALGLLGAGSALKGQRK